MVANGYTGTISSTNPTLRILSQTRSSAVPFSTRDLNYPCTIWVDPISGSTVSVQFNLTSQPGDAVNWTPGNITVKNSQVLSECPGDIIVNLVSGSGATIGVI